MKIREALNRCANGAELRVNVGVLLCGVLLLSGSAGGLFGQAPEKRKVTELFHVSRVGQGGAAETRETLMTLFENVSKEYNDRVQREQKKNPQVFKGERVRVLKRLGDQDKNGPLFLVAYDGGPSVMSVSGDAKMAPGDLSPPLTISEAGEHTIEITRRVRVKDKNEKEPALEVVDETKGGGGATFFGIPIDTGGGGSSSGGSSSTSGGGGGGGSSGPTYQTITETNTLKKFSGVVSTERIDGEPQKMSTDLFVKQLKNGEFFAVSRTEQRRCQECRGFGRVTSTRPIGFRDADGKMACPFCKSVGKVDWEVTYQVFW